MIEKITVLVMMRVEITMRMTMIMMMTSVRGGKNE